jgi:heat shock protein HslJ
MSHPSKFSTVKCFLNFITLLAVIFVSQQTYAQDSELGLFGKKWTLTEMEGRKFNADKPNIEFDRDQKRVSGSGGCNRFSGAFEIDGAMIKFSRIASTKMACLDAEVQRIETKFLELLETTTRFEIQENTLRLYANDVSVLVLVDRAANSQTRAPTGAADLKGTSWQLVKFQGGDDKTIKPDDGSKYTITFGNDGRVSARIDCNRGSGTWKSSGPNQLQFGPLGLTRAMCPPGSLHDRIARDWSAVRSYVIRDGHLFLSLMADGGIYEFEPIGGSQPENSEARVTGC